MACVHFRLETVARQLDSTRLDWLLPLRLSPPILLVHLRGGMTIHHGADVGAAAAAAVPTSITPSATTLSGPFFPPEIQSVIIGFACLKAEPSTSSSTPDFAALFPEIHNTEIFTRIDRPTMLKLLTVCKAFYSVTAPLLYRNATLSRPSALDSFARTLNAQPQLYKHIRSLFVGDLSKSPEWETPLVARRRTLHFTVQEPFGSVSKELPGSTLPSAWYLSSSLRSPKEAALLPRWCSRGQQVLLEAPETPEPRCQAVFEALQAVQRDLNVDLKRNRASLYGREFSYSVTEWVILLHEAQAALDLYLMAMRRWETVDCSSYPPLMILGYPAPLRPQDLHLQSDDAQPYILTRTDILRHLARPHSPTDRFDHPIHFARAGIDVIHCSSPTGHHPRNAAFWDRVLSTGNIDPTLPSTSTMASMLNLLRSLLRRTRNLKALRVTSFLERAVCCSPTSSSLAPLPGLHSLLIGPLPAGQWSAPLRFAPMPNLKRLHLCCGLLEPGEIESIVENLTGLECLSWDVQVRFRKGDAER